MRAVGVATLMANSVKKQRINAKSDPPKCSGLEISRRRQYLRDDWSGIAAERLENDIFVRTHLHTARIVVRMSIIKKDRKTETIRTTYIHT